MEIFEFFSPAFGAAITSDDLNLLIGDSSFSVKGQLQFFFLISSQERVTEEVSQTHALSIIINNCYPKVANLMHTYQNFYGIKLLTILDISVHCDKVE